MAMQRTLNPDGTVRLVDLGPLTAHPLPGYSLRGHAVTPGPTRYHSVPTPEQIARDNARRRDAKRAARAKA